MYVHVYAYFFFLPNFHQKSNFKNFNQKIEESGIPGTHLGQKFTVLLLHVSPPQGVH